MVPYCAYGDMQLPHTSDGYTRYLLPTQYKPGDEDGGGVFEGG